MPGTIYLLKVSTSYAVASIIETSNKKPPREINSLLDHLGWMIIPTPINITPICTNKTIIQKAANVIVICSSNTIIQNPIKNPSHFNSENLVFLQILIFIPNNKVQKQAALKIIKLMALFRSKENDIGKIIEGSQQAEKVTMADIKALKILLLHPMLTSHISILINIKNI